MESNSKIIISISTVILIVGAIAIVLFLTGVIKPLATPTPTPTVRPTVQPTPKFSVASSGSGSAGGAGGIIVYGINPNLVSGSDGSLGAGGIAFGAGGGAGGGAGAPGFIYVVETDITMTNSQSYIINQAYPKLTFVMIGSGGSGGVNFGGSAGNIRIAQINNLPSGSSITLTIGENGGDSIVMGPGYTFIAKGGYSGDQNGGQPNLSTNTNTGGVGSALAGQTIAPSLIAAMNSALSGNI